MDDPRKKVNLELYQKIYLIRRAEEVIIDHNKEDEMKTPIHLYIGGEAIAGGICHALGQDNHILCTYRSHGVYLANTMETNKFFGELYGKSSGMLKGRGGSMHLSSPETGLFGASAIVASSIPVAVGVAFANAYRGKDKATAVFFGDGAIDEGDFWESLNLACLLKLPVIFVCEDNGFAVHTSTSERHGYTSICDIVRQFQCHILTEETTDVERIYQLTNDALKIIKKNNGPVFMYLKYYRYKKHVGVREDSKSYRTQAQFEKWLAMDPIKLQRDKLTRHWFTDAAISSIGEAIDIRIKDDMEQARIADFPNPLELFEKEY